VPDNATKESTAARTTPVLAAVVLLGIFPFVGGKFYVDLMVTTMILAIFALSLELLVGRTGLVSFGHAAFFGIAAYATALLSPQNEAASIAWLLPAAVVISALAALGIGALSLRTRGIYFIMVTLAFGEMLFYLFHDNKFAGGSDGTFINIKPEAMLFGVNVIDLDKARVFYWVVLALVALTLIWGFNWIALKFALARADPVILNVHRTWIAVIVLFAILLWQRHPFWPTSWVAVIVTGFFQSYSAAKG